MTTPSQGERASAILPAPACDLLDRLSKELGLGFSLTDLHGAIVASTAERLAGSVDVHARYVASAAERLADTQDAAEGVYVPVMLSGKIAGVLIAHANAEQTRNTAMIAAAAIGMALDFAEAASALGRENVNAGWLLYRLLRGSRDEAHQARVIAAIYGWNLFVSRVALAVVAQGEGGKPIEGGTRPLDLLRDALGRSAATTPHGQIGESQWVMMVQHEPLEPWSNLTQLGQRLADGFAQAGLTVSVGIGQPHLPVRPIVAVRRSYREALFAARIGPQIAPHDQVHQLRSLGPAAFFAPSTPSRRHLASRVLEPLKEHPAVMATLAGFLSANMSVADAADALGMHRHTVRNHLDRIKELTGLDPRSLEGAVTLRLALLVAAAADDSEA